MSDYQQEHIDNMKIENFKRLYKNDYNQEFQSMIDSLSFTINPGFEVIYTALNKRLTFNDNFNSTLATVDIKVDANGIPVGNNSFSTSIYGPVIGVFIIRAANQTNANMFPTAQPFVSFTQNQNNVVINHISGLQPDNIYSLTVVALGS